MHEEGLSGTAIAAMLDGTRPLLFEVQALVSSAVYGTAQRSATGFDVRRLNMLLAVLERRAGFKLGQKDVFLNMAGGLRVTDPACDLAVVCAVLSSNFDFPISSDFCFAGEVGLSGEVRPVPQTDRRISEAGRLGFSKIYVSSFSAFERNPADIGSAVAPVPFGRRDRAATSRLSGFDIPALFAPCSSRPSRFLRNATSGVRGIYPLSKMTVFPAFSALHELRLLQPPPRETPRHFFDVTGGATG